MPLQAAYRPDRRKPEAARGVEHRRKISVDHDGKWLGGAGMYESCGCGRIDSRGMRRANREFEVRGKTA